MDDGVGLAAAYRRHHLNDLRLMHRFKRPESKRLPRPVLVCGLVLLLFHLELSADIMLQQADGSSLSLPQAAKTLITLAPHLTELAFAAGAGRQVIATVEYSEFPAAAAAIPRIGDAFRLDLERTDLVHPTLQLFGEERVLRTLSTPQWIHRVCSLLHLRLHQISVLAEIYAAAISGDS